MKLDLSSLQSTKQFIEDFKQKNIPLHILICNAGIFLVPLDKTENDLEMHFQVNHLGHFLICLELLPCMINTDGDKRIVLVSSSVHSAGVWNPNNLQGETSYSRWTFYGNSKLYNVMTMYALQRRVMDNGITVSSLHPGFVKTGLQQGDIGRSSILIKPMLALGMAKSPQDGAKTQINCAINPSLNSRQAIFYNSNGRPSQPQVASRNEQYQEELWRISCDLLKDWMSPEIWSKYSPSTETTATAAKQDSGNIDGEDDQPTTITDENKPVEDGDKPVEDGDKPVEDGDKPVEDGNKPVEDGNNPVEDGDKPPVEDGDKSVQDGDKSAEGY
ncbi:retinol dehydrogenase 11-like isoform X2 [Dysidea avara]